MSVRKAAQELLAAMESKRKVVAVLISADLIPAAKALRVALEAANTVEVPVEPPQAVLAAIVEANAEHDVLYPIDDVRRSERIYRAMIAAAQEKKL